MDCSPPAIGPAATSQKSNGTTMAPMMAPSVPSTPSP